MIYIVLHIEIKVVCNFLEIKITNQLEKFVLNQYKALAIIKIVNFIFKKLKMLLMKIEQNK